MSEPEIQFLKEFLNDFSLKVDEQIEYIKNQEKKEKEKEKQRLESLKKSQTNKDTAFKPNLLFKTNCKTHSINDIHRLKCLPIINLNHRTTGETACL
jgi:hypothetical protein